MCVAERLSGFCEAILNVDDLCKSNLRCCVSKETYDNDDAPGALFIPNGSKPPPPVKRKTTKRPKPKPKKKPPKRKSGGGDCKGTCVTGFFALLCEDIDKSVECPGLRIQKSKYLDSIYVLGLCVCTHESIENKNHPPFCRKWKMLLEQGGQGLRQEEVIYLAAKIVIVFVVVEQRESKVSRRLHPADDVVRVQRGARQIQVRQRDGVLQVQ